MNLLLVDDELFALEALKNAISWADCGIDQVFTCSNISTAKQLFEQKEISVMICDIEMPNGSGMDLTAWVFTHFPKTKTIFLTCHSDFQYAREAISYRAFAYLLKPFDIDEITDVVSDAAAELHKLQDSAKRRKGTALQQQSIAEHFWYQLIQNQSQNSTLEYIQWDAKRQNISFNPQKHYLPSLFFMTSDFPDHLDPGLLRFCIKNALSEVFCLDKEMPPILDLDSRFFLLLISPRQVCDSSHFHEECERLYQFLEEHFQIKLQCFLGKEGDYRFMAKQLPTLLAQAESVLSSSAGNQTGENPQQIVERIIELIKEKHILSREELAGKVYLSPDYMAKLFKRETGKTLGEYLQEVKLAEAKYLLVESNLSISEIASKLSYSNFSYFSKMFRSETGVSPGIYRKQHSKQADDTEEL